MLNDDQNININYRERRSVEKLSADKTITESKKAKAILIALVNLNLIFFCSLYFPLEAVLQMITSILFLVGIYVGVQGGVEMIQSNRLDVSRSQTQVRKEERKEIVIKDESYKMDYAE